MAVWGGFPPWDDASFFYHTGVSLYLPLPMSCCACPPLSRRGKGTHTQCRRVVLAGKRRPASIWRPWHLWLPGWLWRPQPRQFWRSRDSLGPGVSRRSRWQLGNPLSGRLLGPRRQRRVFQLGHQRSGTVTIRALRLSTSCPSSPHSPCLPHLTVGTHTRPPPLCRGLWSNLVTGQ